MICEEQTKSHVKVDVMHFANGPDPNIGNELRPVHQEWKLCKHSHQQLTMFCLL